MHKQTLRRFHEALLPWKSNKYYIFLRECVCVCARARGRARVALLVQHAKRMRCHLWLFWLHRVFPHYLINGTIFGKRLWNIKCVFYFLYKFYLKYSSF
jgi:hypothetical protein